MAETSTTGQPEPVNKLTEEEASRYDRQMRLWGVEAQTRMRNATILVIRLKGTATEAIKNVVLAGIGKLIVVDSDVVSEEDLGAGFFFRDEDVGMKRVDAAKSRIESLNPLVTVETISDMPVLEGPALESLVKRVDLVCVTDWDRDNLIRLNEVCRKSNKPFYAGGTYGLLGYIFCDLLTHDYITPERSGSKEEVKSVKKTTTYPSLDAALRHDWASLTRKQTKEVNPGVVFSILGLWQFQSTNSGLPQGEEDIRPLESLINTLISDAHVNKQALSPISEASLRSLVTTAKHEFSPVCAIVGGMLAQDILKALGARDPPIANLFVFDGNTGAGTVIRMNMV